MFILSKQNGKLVPFVIGCLGLLLASGCESIPKDALKLSPESLQRRVLQTRKYEGIIETDLLAASAGLIQDLGFNIDESETGLGIIVASKERSALEVGQIALSIFAAMFGAEAAIDKNQKLKLSLVVRPTRENSLRAHFVRVTFQRIVWNTNNDVSRVEALDEPEIYRDFFDRLSKSVFLEGQKI